MGKTVRKGRSFCLYIWVETRAGHRVSKGEFPSLRRAERNTHCAQSALMGKTVRKGRSFCLYIWVETRAGHRVSKGEFPSLRRATLCAATRLRKPLKRIDTNLIMPLRAAAMPVG